MKQMEYVVRYLVKGRGNSLIKIISLTLGLVVGLVLYSQIAFEMSYDNFYPDKEMLYRIRRTCLVEDKETYGGARIYSAMPRALMTDLKEVESATLTASTTELTTFQREDKKYIEKTLNVDECFLEVFQFPVLSGNTKSLALPNQAFLSRSAAERMFGERNPVGEQLLCIQYDCKKIPITVAGVIDDVPENSMFDFDVLLSIQTVFSSTGWEPGWQGVDAFFGYVKLQAGMSAAEVEARIPEMLSTYYDVKALESKGQSYTYSLEPVVSLHQKDPEVKKILLILSLLASSLVFVSAMNYVLISISSLVKRSRLVGVYKTCGASNGNIFVQFIAETALLVFVSLLLSAFIIFVFREPIEALIRMPVAAVFSLRNVSVLFTLVLSLILIAGVIPAQLFSVIPATQAFRSGSVNKRYWKNGLLFVQFVSITAISCLLLILVRQYHMMIHTDWGYSTENVLFVQLNGVPAERMNRIKTEFQRAASVTSVSLCTNIPLRGMNGDAIFDPETQNTLFMYKLMGADADYLKTLQITLLSGENFNVDGKNEQDVLVNEAFIKKMHDVQYPTDKLFRNIDGEKRIVGVVKDFQLFNLYKETEPALICSVDPVKGVWWATSYLVLKTTQNSTQLLAELNQKLFSLTENDNLFFKDYREVWTQEYAEARLFRNSVIAASVIMLLLTILGLLGYVEDEIIRRSKEIAIRKLNGASAQSIVCTLSKDFTCVVIPALVLGTLLAYYLGAGWLHQFAEKTPLRVSLFMLACWPLLLILYACIGIRSWRVANANPVHSLTSE